MSDPMSSGPLVSVLTPAYNAESTIRETVTSALAQSVPELEVIVVDDGSTEPAAKALDVISDHRLRVFRTAANRGVSAARNSALALARAPVVAQLDADDYWHPFHLEGLLAVLSDTSVGLAYANAEVLGHPRGFDRWIEPREPGVPAEPDGPPRVSVTGAGSHPVNDLAELYLGNPIPSAAVAMRTQAARAVGGYPEWLRVGEDYLLYLRIRQAGWRFAYVDRASAVYRWPDSSRGATFDRRRNAREQAKLFAALAVSEPGERAVQARLAGELANIVTTHVPGSLAAGRRLRRRWSRPTRR